MIYLDNAATSWPKPPVVKQAMDDFLEQAGGNPGRSGHRRSIEAARILYNAREAVAGLFNAPDPLKVIFTLNATHAINYALKGILKPGDIVITTSMEHNSVMRPLRSLQERGVNLKIAPCRPDGTLIIDGLNKLVDLKTKMVVINHGSNVTGALAPLTEIAAITRKTGALLMIDASQTAGTIPIDMKNQQIDLVAFTGHKALLGPTGTGGLIIGDRVNINNFSPLMQGGTGSNSEYETQPEYLPDKYEFGTPNITGIAGLLASINWINKNGIDSIKEQESHLAGILRHGLLQVPGLTLYGPPKSQNKIAVTSFTVKNKEVSEIGLILDEDFNILCRVGLHCAPAAHKTIGTFPKGTVRLAPGIFNTVDEIKQVINAVNKIALS
jgi:cysteine desulfurase/selenocysteine lyase